MMIAASPRAQTGAEIFGHRFGEEAAVLVGLHDMVAVRGFAQNFVPVHLASFLRQQLRQRRPDHIRLERLAQVDVFVAVARAHAPVFLGAHEDDRRAARALEAANRRGDFVAVHSRQAHVEQDGDELVLQHQAQRVFARLREQQLRAQVAQQLAEGELRRLVVFDHQQVHIPILPRTGSRPCGSSRLETNATAPAPSAALRSASESFTDMITTGHDGQRRRSSRVASMPFGSGQLEVHQHEIGNGQRRLIKSLLQVARLAQARRRQRNHQPVAQSGPHAVVAFNQENGIQRVMVSRRSRGGQSGT